CRPLPATTWSARKFARRLRGSTVVRPPVELQRRPRGKGRKPIGPTAEKTNGNRRLNRRLAQSQVVCCGRAEADRDDSRSTQQQQAHVLMRRGGGRRSTIVAGLAAALALAGCGSGSRQDVNQPTGKFPVQVTSATFPSSQRLAQHTHLVLSVRNAGNKTIPDVAVSICNTTCGYPAPVGEGTSVSAFAQYLNMPGVASHSRPVWVVERPPGAC